MVDAGTGAGGQRFAAAVMLLVAGAFSLPLAAALFDGEGAENWIIPAQLVGMAAVGAGVGALLPGVAGGGASVGRGARIGAVLGVAAAVLGVVVFFLLLSGFDGP
jgi:hypothetical protein